MKYSPFQIAVVLTAGLVLASCASKRTVTTTTKRDPMMQHFAGNFETVAGEGGQKKSGSDRRSSFENKSYYGTKDFKTKSFGKKEFQTKEFGTKEFGRDSYEFVGDRNVRLKESDLGDKAFAGAGKVADTDKTLYDRNKEVVRTPFAGADKAAVGRPFYPAEKSQKQGDGEFKKNVRPYERDSGPITFSDIRAMLNRGGE